VGRAQAPADAEALIERALAYCDWAVAQGLLAIRSHVDVCDPRLLAVDALLEVKRRVAPYLDLQLVAFPQDGVLRSPGALDLLKARSGAAWTWWAASPLRAHHGRGRGQRDAAVRAGGRAGQACGHALRRERRPAVAPCRDPGLRDPAPGPARPRHRLAPDLHAQHGQLLRQQAAGPDGRGPAERGGQPADQHHAAGPARQLPQAARHDPRARAAGRRPDRGLRPRLRDGPLVQPGAGGHAGGGVHGPACGPDDRPGGDAPVLRGGDHRAGPDPGPGPLGLAVGREASFVLLQARDPVEALRLRAQRLGVWRRGCSWPPARRARPP
jgi:cytosine deaminase